MKLLKLLIIISFLIANAVLAKGKVGSVGLEDESNSIVDEIKIIRTSGEDIEVVFKNHKGVYFLPHTSKQFEEMKKSLLKVQNLGWKASINYDNMTDRIQTVKEVEVKKEDPKEAKSKEPSW